MKRSRQLLLPLPTPTSLLASLRTHRLPTPASGLRNLKRLLAALLVVPISSTVIALVPPDPSLIRTEADQVEPAAAQVTVAIDEPRVIAEPRSEASTAPVAAAVESQAPAEPAVEVSAAPPPAQAPQQAQAPAQTALEPVKYVVAPGDTVWTVAERFRVAPEAVLLSNDLSDPNRLEAGRELLLPPVPGLLHRVEEGDSIVDLAARYSVDAQQVAAANGLQSADLIRAGSTLVVPNGRVPAPPTPAEVARTEEQAEDKLADNLIVPEAELPRPAGAASAEADFILQAAVAARDSQRETAVPASVTIAQAILESDWGRSRLSAENKNYFGIKAHGRPGSAGVVNYDTWEVVNGRNVVVKAPFRAYASMTDSFVDHGRFFIENSRYGAAMRVTGDAQAFARAIAAAGYATDPAYPEKLIRLMDKFNLYAYDLR